LHPRGRARAGAARDPGQRRGAGADRHPAAGALSHRRLAGGQAGRRAAAAAGPAGGGRRQRGLPRFRRRLAPYRPAPVAQWRRGDDMTRPRAPKRAKPSATRKATAREVAAAAGVSISAVSRTFTAGASVSAATRSKVLDASRSLGYQPNLLARGL